MSSNTGASAPAVLSTLARTAGGSAAPLAVVAGSPTGTGPVAEGTASTYWAIAASDGTVGGGAPAVAGDATTTATPAEQVAAMEHPHRHRLDYASKSWTRRARAGRGEPGLSPTVALTLLVGGVFFVLAYENGSYDTTTWAAAAVLVWWTLGLVAVGVLPGRRPRVRRS